MNKTLRVAAIALASVLALAACAETKTSRSAGAYVDDTAITGKVKTAILQDPALKVMQIDVTADTPTRRRWSDLPAPLRAK